jgi:hypothetical protein
MSRSARVTSIDVLPTLAAAIQKFRADAAGALDELELETRRALEWIRHDRKTYWTHELRRRSEAVAQARVQLQQARTFRSVVGHEPACIDEKRALERAQRRYSTAQQKIEAVRHWTRAIDHAVNEYQRDRVQFLAWLEGDLAKATAALNRMTASLESYISLATPPAGTATLPEITEPPTSGAAAADPPEPTADQKPSER